MTLHSAFDWQLYRISRSLNQPYQTFGRPVHSRALPNLPSEAPRTFSHGTRGGYVAGCRCVGCVTAMRSQVDIRREARAAAGLCRDCGLEAPMPNRTRCDGCRERHNARSRASQQRQRVRKYFTGAQTMCNFRTQPSLFQSAEGAA